MKKTPCFVKTYLILSCFDSIVPFSSMMTRFPSHHPQPPSPPPSLQALCVYGGSRKGNHPSYTEDARVFGRQLAGAGIRLIYGGGNIGVMGAIAEAVLAAGGKVTGVVPAFFDQPANPSPNLDQLIVADSLHTRKATMMARSDAFVAFPGGLGTFDEIFEILTMAYLNRHNRPLVLAGDGAYWQPLILLLDHMITHGFLTTDVHQLYHVVANIEDILPLLMRVTGDKTAQPYDPGDSPGAIDTGKK